jgi:hypothetical protein
MAKAAFQQIVLVGICAGAIRSCFPAAGLDVVEQMRRKVVYLGIVYEMVGVCVQNVMRDSHGLFVAVGELLIGRLLHFAIAPCEKEKGPNLGPCIIAVC